MTDKLIRTIVAKLWNLCHILRDDGVSYNEYVTELTEQQPFFQSNQD
jgi:type I restriction enzyme M protein